MTADGVSEQMDSCEMFVQEGEAAGGPPAAAVQSQPAPPAGVECQTEQRDGRERPSQDQSRGRAAHRRASGLEGESSPQNLLCVFRTPVSLLDGANWTLLFVQTEIDARAERIDSVRDFGLGLIRSGHTSKSEIQKSLSQLEEAKSGLDRAWLNRNTTLEQARTLQVMI